MRNPEYWADRFSRLEKAQNANGVTYAKRVASEYNKAIRSIEKDLSYWYTRFGKENGVSYAEAKRLLNSDELKAFKMDVKEYIKKGESLDPKWQDELKQASAKVHVSRLQSIQLQLQQEVEKLSGDFSKGFSEFASDTYSKQYYHTAFELQKGLKIGWDVMRLDKNKVDKIIRKPWASDGRNFSDRVWANRSKLVNELHTTLAQGIIRGDAPQKMIKRIQERMGVSRNAASRLILTENSFFSNMGARDAYKTLDVERYQILATLDMRTSEICREMDGKVFNQSDFEIGVSAPPFHPYCRTTTIPYFEDNEGFRAARGDDGEYYTVPADMTYKDWEKTFVNGGSKEGLEKVKPVDALLAINEASNLFKNYGEQHYQAMHTALIENGNEDLIRVWGQNEASLLIDDCNSGRHPHFNPRSEGITINIKEDAKGCDWSKPYQTSFHELGHNIDYILGGKNKILFYSNQYKNGLFGETIKNEINNKLKEIEDAYKEALADKKTRGDVLFKKGVIEENWVDYYNKYPSEARIQKKWIYNDFRKELMSIPRIARSSLSDIVEGATGGKVNAEFGHGKAYWRQEENLAIEAFAEFWGGVANPEEWEVLKKYLPESVKVFEQMIKDAIK